MQSAAADTQKPYLKAIKPAPASRVKGSGTTLAEPMAALLTTDGDALPRLVFLERPEAIEFLRVLVERCQREQGISFRRAIKVVAREVRLSNMRVRRLIDLDPDD